VLVVPARSAEGRLERFELFVQRCEPRAPPERHGTGRFVQAILEALPNPVFVKDEQHRWVLLNDAFCRFLGRSREELLGRSDYDFFPKAEADVFWDKDDGVFRTGALNENEERFTDQAGRRHVILTRKLLHADRDGRRFLLGVITDITDRKDIEEELRRSRDVLDERVRQRTEELERLNARLQEEDRRKNEFLGVLSHELRNPLAPILNAVEILERAAADGERIPAARAVIRRQVEHLTHLVDDLLDVTRISRGKIQLHRAAVDLAAAIRRTAEDHREAFERRRVALEVRTPDEGDLTTWADPTRVAQIVGNLLHNAEKFTKAGGAVTLSVERIAPDRAAIRVRDDGVGIPASMLDRVFEPFTQADAGLARSGGGLGLGLALVKALAELQGGTATARSEGPGRGAEFTVTLPVVVVPAAAPEARPPAAPPRRRVLVVEDNADAAETLRIMLDISGHEVEVAFDGNDGLARARAFRPDVVLCDLGLPGLDGFEVARAVRSDPRLAGTVLVAVSGYALPEDRRRALEAGFDRHLAKPVALADIEHALAEAPARPVTGVAPSPPRPG
jgi:PAS domain S-box-containing protein